MKIIILLFVISVSFTQKILSQGFDEELPGNSWTVSLTQFEDQTYFLKLENETLKNSYSNLYMLNKNGVITHSKKINRKKKYSKFYEKWYLDYQKNFSEYISNYPTEYQIIDKENKVIYNLKDINKVIYNLKDLKLIITDEALNQDSLSFKFPWSSEKNLTLMNECYKGLDENKNPYWMFDFYDEELQVMFVVKFDVKTKKINLYYSTFMRKLIAKPIGYLDGKFLFCRFKRNFSDSTVVEICSLDKENIVNVENKFTLKLPKDLNRAFIGSLSLKFISPDHLINKDNLYFTVKIGYEHYIESSLNYQFIFYKYDGNSIESVVYKNESKDYLAHEHFNVIENSNDEVRFMIHNENGAAIVWDVNFNQDDVTDRTVFFDIAKNKDCIRTKTNYRKDDAIYNLYLFEKLLDSETLKYINPTTIENDKVVPLVFLNYKGNAEIIKATIDCLNEKTTFTFDPTTK